MIVRKILLAFILVLLAGCVPLASIPYIPAHTPESWLNIQPFVEIHLGSTNFILVQPSSTIIVYLLGIITIGVGIFFFRNRAGHQSRWWWGIALLLWGLGALFAGTSYQAFSYEIKCVGQVFCSWTSWFEIIYLILSVGSIDAMVIAGAYSGFVGKWRKGLAAYALGNFIIYDSVVLLGTLLLNKFMISFELLLVFSAPSILMLFILNTWRYQKYKERMDLALMVTWLWLGVTIGAYFLALVTHMTEVLWERGRWFSENDVLHIGLITWMLFIVTIVAPQIVDQPGTEKPKTLPA